MIIERTKYCWTGDKPVLYFEKSVKIGDDFFDFLVQRLNDEDNGIIITRNSKEVYRYRVYARLGWISPITEIMSTDFGYHIDFVGHIVVNSKYHDTM